MMATRLSKRFLQSMKGRLYSTQVANKGEAAVVTRGGMKISEVEKIKVAALDSEQSGPLSRVVFAVKAGSKYETPANLGITHLIRHNNQLTNTEVLFEELVEDLQGMGASLSFCTTRDNAYAVLTCMKDQVFEAVNLIYPTLSRRVFKTLEIKNVQMFKNKIEQEIQALEKNPSARVVETLHSAAFRGGLGNPLYVSKDNIDGFSPNDMLNWIADYYKTSRMMVTGSGVYQEDLRESVEAFLAEEDISQFLERPGFKKLPRPKLITDDASGIVEPKTIYTGGEARVNLVNTNANYSMVAFEGPSLKSGDLIAAAVLQQILGGDSQIKYKTNNNGRLSKAVGELGQIAGYNANYADSGLFGFFGLSKASATSDFLRKAVGEIKNIGSKGVTDEDLAIGKAHLKAEFAYRMEDGGARLMRVTDQLLAGTEPTTVSDVLSKIDAVSTSDVNQVAKKVFSGKPTMASVGNNSKTPYLSDLF